MEASRNEKVKDLGFQNETVEECIECNVNTGAVWDVGQRAELPFGRV